MDQFDAMQEAIIWPWIDDEGDCQELDFDPDEAPCDRMCGRCDFRDECDW